MEEEPDSTMSERVDNSGDIPTLKEVIDELGIFERWYPLGVHLKLVHPVLKAITRDEHDTEMRCITMVEKWLDSKSNPSWGELCKALQDMKEHALADRITKKYCPDMQAKSQQPKPAIPCEQPPHAGNGPLVERQLPQVPEDDDDASKKQPFDVAFEFAFMFANVVKLLGETADVEILKTFLESLCELKTHLPYVSLKLYEHCTTTAEVLKSLQPQLINSMHLYLLKKIVDKFGCDKAKEFVKLYDTNFPREIPLKRLGNPLTDEEIEACIGTKTLKVVIDRDPNGVTKRDVEVYQGVIVRNTGIPPEVVVYAKHTTGSVVLMFLIPEGTTEVFINPTVERLLFLLGSGVVRMEVDGDICTVLERLDMIVEVEERPVQVTPRKAITGSNAGSTTSSDSGYGSRTGSSTTSSDSGYGSRTGSHAMSSQSGIRVR